MRRYILGLLFITLLCCSAIGQVKKQYIYLWDTSLFLKDHCLSYDIEKDISARLLETIKESSSTTDIIVLPFQMYDLDVKDKEFVDKSFARLAWMIKRLKKQNVRITKIDVSKTILSVSSLVNPDIPSYIYMLTDGKQNIYKILSISNLLTDWNNRAASKNATLHYFIKNIKNIPSDFKKIDKNLSNFSIVNDLDISKAISTKEIKNVSFKNTKTHLYKKNKASSVALEKDFLLSDYIPNIPSLVSSVKWWYYLILFLVIILILYMFKRRFFLSREYKKTNSKIFKNGDFTSNIDDIQLDYLLARGIQKTGKLRGKVDIKEFPLSVIYGEPNAGIVDIFTNNTLIGIKDVSKNEFIIDRQRSLVDGTSLFLGHPRYEKKSSYKINDKSNFHSFETNDLGGRIKFYSKLTPEYYKEIKGKKAKRMIAEEERKSLTFYDADMRFSPDEIKNSHNKNILTQYNDAAEYIIPLSCGGLPEVVNQYPQAFIIIQSKIALVEKLILEYLDRGETVEVRGSFIYSNYTFRPSEISYSINIEGKKPITFNAFINKNISVSEEHINL